MDEGILALLAATEEKTRQHELAKLEYQKVTRTNGQIILILNAQSDTLSLILEVCRAILAKLRIIDPDDKQLSVLLRMIERLTGPTSININQTQRASGGNMSSMNIGSVEGGIGKIIGGDNVEGNQHKTVNFGAAVQPSVWYDQAVSGLQQLKEAEEITMQEKERLTAEVKQYEADFIQHEQLIEAGEAGNLTKLYRFVKKLPRQPWRVAKILQAGMPIPPPFSNAAAFATEFGKELESEEAAQEIQAQFAEMESRIARMSERLEGV